MRNIATRHIAARPSAPPASREDADRRPPLSESVYCILLALADRDRHGYAIMQRVEEMTDGATRLGPGTLYGALGRLLDEGTIAECPGPAGEGREDVRRRYYRLTPRGRTQLAGEARRLRHLSALAAHVRLTPVHAGG